MSSYHYGGQVEMKPVVEENVGNDFMEDEGYPYAIPKVYLEGYTEQYYPQVVFDWSNDSVVLVRDKRVLRYTRSSFVELLAKELGIPYEEVTKSGKGSYINIGRTKEV